MKLIYRNIYRYVKIIPKTIGCSIANTFNIMHYVTDDVHISIKIKVIMKTFTYEKFSLSANSSRMLTLMPRIAVTSPASL